MYVQIWISQLRKNSVSILFSTLVFFIFDRVQCSKDPFTRGEIWIQSVIRCENLLIKRLHVQKIWIWIESRITFNFTYVNFKSAIDLIVKFVWSLIRRSIDYLELVKHTSYAYQQTKFKYTHTCKIEKNICKL